MIMNMIEPEQPLIPGGARRSAEYYWASPEPVDHPTSVEADAPYGPKTPGQLADELIAANLEENKDDIERGYNPKVAHGRTALHLMGSKTFTSEETSAALETIGSRSKELGIPAHRVSVNLARLTTDGMERARHQEPELDYRQRQAGPSSL